MPRLWGRVLDEGSCGVKPIAVPWAENHSRFTLLFEAFAIEVLQASLSIQSAARGFRIFEHDRIRILFYCGKLSLKP
ncbi:MAG: helix-turn-helix domain-containing protein [Planctomyces sp.]